MSYRLTIRQCIDRAAGRLRAVGVDTPRVDAELLLLHVLQTAGEPTLKRSDLFFRHPDPISDDIRDQFQILIERRAQHEPVQHIIGHTNFSGVELLCGPGAFIPRPETELLVEWASRRLGERVKANALDMTTGADVAETGADGTEPRSLRLIDLCTGPATIVLGLAHTLTNRPLKTDDGQTPTIELVGVEASDSALQWAERNLKSFAQRTGMSVTVSDADGTHLHAQRPGLTIDIYQGDVTDTELLRSLMTPNLAVVVSNPPYVPQSTEVSPEVRFDPAMAVFSGPTGLEVITPMLQALTSALSSPSAPSQPVLVAIEHDDTTQPQVIAQLENLGAQDILGKRDLADRPRYVTASFDPHQCTSSASASGTS